MRIYGGIRDGGSWGDAGRKSGVNSESEVEEGGGSGEETRGEERRERFVFMLLETEVFLAPPTHRRRKRGMGEEGCFVGREGETVRKRGGRRYCEKEAKGG